MKFIYSDELVTATELNRQPDRILDKALEHPIAITRNNQSSALLSRKDVALFVKTARYNRELVELLNTAFRLLLKQTIGNEHPYGWLAVFDTAELNEFINEVMSAYRVSDRQEQAWNELEEIIHEWYRKCLSNIQSRIRNCI